MLNLRTGELDEFPPTGEQLMGALDVPPRGLLFVWQNNPDDELLVTDADTGETFHLPPSQVAHYAVWRAHPHTPVRAECWDGRPVWGAA